MQAVRSFIAVFLDPALRPQVVELQRRLAQSGADVKWVEPENLHFTLKFLGDVESSRLEALTGRLRACVVGVRGFELALGPAGAFPRVQDPRVIWVGVSAGRAQFTALASLVEEAMKAEGFRGERREISPHLTVGRVRSARNVRALAERLSSSAPLHGGMRVDAVQLVASELTVRGPVYRPIAVVSLSS
ncbi:MAG: RNA 2',3'-cyclic phosphodiesterase [Betaproteobacteria bacterium]